MSSDQGRVNSNLPGSYQPVMNENNFAAPAHNLSTKQAEQVAELAEASTGHIQPGPNVAGGVFGSGSLGNTGNTNLADTLSSNGGQSGQRGLGGNGSTGLGSSGQQGGHLGQYEYTEDQLDEPLDRVGRGAAGTGAGSGLAATAASQGLGSRGQERTIEDQRLGGLIGDDNSYNNNSSSSRSGAGVGTAAAVGTGALGAAGLSSHGSGGHGTSGGVAGLSAGQRDASGHGAGAGDKGMLAQPQYETGLTSELERRAQKSGTHAAGFGTHGNE